MFKKPGTGQVNGGNNALTRSVKNTGVWSNRDDADEEHKSTKQARVL